MFWQFTSTIASNTGISRESQVKLADSYLSRMRGFQNQLLIWGVTINLAVLGYLLRALKIKTLYPLLITPLRPCHSIVVLIGLIFTNLLIWRFYSTEHNNSHELLKRFPELPSVSVSFFSNYDILNLVFWIYHSLLVLILGIIVSRII